jgi:hypothetical protein
MRPALFWDVTLRNIPEERSLVNVLLHEVGSYDCPMFPDQFLYLCALL